MMCLSDIYELGCGLGPMGCMGPMGLGFKLMGHKPSTNELHHCECMGTHLCFYLWFYSFDLYLVLYVFGTGL